MWHVALIVLGFRGNSDWGNFGSNVWPFEDSVASRISKISKGEPRKSLKIS